MKDLDDEADIPFLLYLFAVKALILAPFRWQVMSKII